jgi:hypothetical protein
MAVSLAASVSNSGGKPTELFQHSPKRDKGPQLPMKKELLSPTPPQNSYHFGGNILESAPNNAILAGPQLALQKDSGMSQGYSLAASNYQHTFERVQFKSATSNNGKRRAQQQQYFHLIVELWANVQAEGDPEPQWAQVAARSTAPIVVRGRSPRTYSNETPHNPNEIGRGSSMPGPRYQGNGLNGGVTYKGSSSALGMNGPEQHNLEQPGEELSCHEWKGKLAETAEKCKIVEKPRYLLPRSGDERIPMLSTPQRTGPNKETQLSSNRSQNLVKVLPVSPNTEGTGLLDVLGAGTRTYTFDHTVAPGNLQRLLSGLEKKTDEIKKMLEEFRNLPSKPASPTPLTQKGNMLTVDRPSEVQRIQDVNENSVSRSLTSDVLSSRPSPATAELPKYSNLPISGLECNSCANGPSFLSKSVEISKNEDNLTSILQPKRMDQRESPSLRAQISTDIIISATEDDTHSFQTIVGPKENVVLLSRPNDSDVSGSPNVTNSLPSSNSPMSRLNIPGDSSVGDAIEELGTIEMDGKSGEAFDECEVSVKSALDVAVVIIKDLLIRELLGYAFPEAINAIEGSHPSSSGPRTGSASNSAFSNLYSCTSNSQAPKRRKRTRGDGHDLGDDDIDYSNDDDDDRPKKKSKSGSPDQLPHRRLKCPFYQRQPEKYKKEVCRGGGFADLAKLKDHIILMHTKPLRCSRCWQEMESEDTYAEHLQRENICMIDAEPQDDRIRRQLLNRLDFKKAPYANARNIEDKWNILFLVLFPNDSKIPSPCRLTLPMVMSLHHLQSQMNSRG